MPSTFFRTALTTLAVSCLLGLAADAPGWGLLAGVALVVLMLAVLGGRT